jgi:hypothetical protein
VDIRRRHEPGNGQGGHAFTAATFADQADRFARANCEGNAVHGARRFRALAKVELQILDFEQIHLDSSS